MSNPTPQQRFPQFQDWEAATRYALNALVDQADAIAALKGQQDTTHGMVTQVTQQIQGSPGVRAVSIAQMESFWLDSYDANTGGFTSSRPSAANLSDTPTTGHVLRGNGTAFVSDTLAAPDLSNGVTGTGFVVLSASPTLTGVPTAPTAAATDNSTEIATTAFVKSQVLSGTSTSLNPGVMTSGQRATVNVTVTGATTAMVATCSPTVDPGAGFVWTAFVSAPNTVTVCLTCVLAGTPSAATYVVRVLI